jgi:hypothetical protein
MTRDRPDAAGSRSGHGFRASNKAETFQQTAAYVYESGFRQRQSAASHAGADALP